MRWGGFQPDVEQGIGGVLGAADAGGHGIGGVFFLAGQGKAFGGEAGGVPAHKAACHQCKQVAAAGILVVGMVAQTLPGQAGAVNPGGQLAV